MSYLLQIFVMFRNIVCWLGRFIRFKIHCCEFSKPCEFIKTCIHQRFKFIEFLVKFLQYSVYEFIQNLTFIEGLNSSHCRCWSRQNWCGIHRNLRPPPHVSGYFVSANFSLRIQNFPRPHAAYLNRICPTHTYPNSFVVRQLICKAIFGSRENFLVNFL